MARVSRCYSSRWKHAALQLRPALAELLRTLYPLACVWPEFGRIINDIMRSEFDEQMMQAISAATVPISAMEANVLLAKLESEGRSLRVFFRASDQSVFLMLRGQITFVDHESIGLRTEPQRGGLCELSLQDCTFSYRDEARVPNPLRYEKYDGALSIMFPSRERIVLYFLQAGES
jgi:hypothetical protein